MKNLYSVVIFDGILPSTPQAINTAFVVSEKNLTLAAVGAFPAYYRNAGINPPNDFNGRIARKNERSGTATVIAKPWPNLHKTALILAISEREYDPYIHGPKF